MTNEAAGTTDEGQATQDPGTTPETVENPAGDQSETPMIPKARFDQVNTRLKEAEAAKAELEALKQAQADEAAKKANDVEKFLKERDEYKAQAERWTQFATAELEALTAELDDAGKEILNDLGDDVSLDKRLGVAKKLAAAKKTTPAMGTKGGSGTREGGGPIPADVQTVAEFHSWWANLMQTPEGRKQVADPEFNKAVTAERIKRFGRR